MESLFPTFLAMCQSKRLKQQCIFHYLTGLKKKSGYLSLFLLDAKKNSLSFYVIPWYITYIRSTSMTSLYIGIMENLHDNVGVLV